MGVAEQYLLTFWITRFHSSFESSFEVLFAEEKRHSVFSGVTQRPILMSQTSRFSRQLGKFVNDSIQVRPDISLLRSDLTSSFIHFYLHMPFQTHFCAPFYPLSMTSISDHAKQLFFFFEIIRRFNELYLKYPCFSAFEAILFSIQIFWEMSLNAY